MTSRRRRKKQAQELGLTERELQMAELLEEVLDALRWQQVLSYSNQFLVSRKLKIDKDERDRILEAATRAVDQDAKLHEWSERLSQIKGEVVKIKREVNRARRDIARGDAAEPRADVSAE